ncbi:MAG TPA: fatty acid desaturase CarF family protein [Planctomycetota bacterium]|jgi:ubiquitin-conjugating enzyme E2 variant|nr:fatty acid desaturase CarF family protein [Planctomycetota bacterium]
MPWIIECTLALLAADFVSGLVHWSEDTFGTESTPILGPWIVVPNVLHHRDAGAFLSKGWLASSWDLALGGLVIVVGAFLAGHLGPGVVVFAVAGANANEIHKWNHARSRAPLVARFLWATGIMQRPVEHARHHAGDKNTAYCVLTPFVNPVLDALGFWRAIERVVVPIFGAPRREDLRNRVW